MGNAQILHLGLQLFFRELLARKQRRETYVLLNGQKRQKPKVLKEKSYKFFAKTTQAKFAETTINAAAREQK